MEESIKTHFFGRKTLLQDIVQGVLAPSQPLAFSLVGPQMIGKSRLLSYLAAAEGPLLGPDPEQWRPERFREGHNVIVALYNCDWPDAQTNLPEFIYRRLRLQLETAKKPPLNWSQIESFESPGQKISQVVYQLGQHHLRLVLLLDNFGHVLRSDRVTLDMVNELRPLTSELGMVVVTREPLHDLNQSLATSPLFNLMHQHFVGLLEPAAAQEWLNAYRQRASWSPSVAQALLEMAGGHPFLLARINDILLEIHPVVSVDNPLTGEYLPLLKLRLAEHGRSLFGALWRRLQETAHQGILPLVKLLIEAPLALEQTSAEQKVALNWLINYAMVAYDNNYYRLFSPLFQEFLVGQMNLEQSLSPAWPATAAIGSSAADVFAHLTPTEAELLRYFQAHSHEVVSVEELLTAVWNQPEATPRRVQEAIRRLRQSLRELTPSVGVIENERGAGYRYIPASGARGV